jgi:hypothetical protein
VRRTLVAVALLVAVLILVWSVAVAPERSTEPRTPGERTEATAARGPEADGNAPTDQEQPATALIAVRVMDADDAPVEGARVGETVTDARGACLLELAPSPRARSLPVLHPGYAPAYLRVPAVAAGDRREIWLRLLRGVTVTGRVVVAGTGEPAVGARVRLSFSSRWYPPSAQEHRDAEVKPDGTVRWERVPAGYIHVSSLAPGYEDAGDSVSLEITPPRAPAPFLLPVVRTTRLVLRFLDPDGNEIREGQLSFDIQGGASGSADFEDGTFEEDIRHGVAIRVEGVDARGRRSTFVWRSDGTPRAKRDVVFEEAAGHRGSGAVRLLVCNESGVSIAGATVSYLFMVGMVGWSEEARTNERGAALLEGLPPGRTDFTVEASGYKPGSTSLVVVRDRTLDGVVHLEAALAIRGRVAEGARAQVTLRRDDRCWETRADEEGGFAFEGLDAGRYSISATAPGGRSSKPRAGIHAGSHDVRLVLGPAMPTGALELICHDAAGRPLPQVAFRIEREGSGPTRGRSTDARGRHRFERLAPGPCSVRLWAPGYREAGPLGIEIEAGGGIKVPVDFGARRKAVEFSVRDTADRPVSMCPIALFRQRDGKKLEAKPEWVHGGLAFWTQSDGRLRTYLPGDEAAVAILTAAGDFESAPVWARRAVIVPRGPAVEVAFVVVRRLEVVGCAAGDPAWRAGFRDGDLVEEWNGERLHSDDDVPSVLFRPARVVVWRAGERVTLTPPAGYLGLILSTRLQAP